MAKERWIGPYLAYNSPYGSESLRTKTDVALRRVLATLERFAVSAVPRRAVLSVYDQQNEALYRATRCDGPTTHSEVAARLAAGHEASPLVAPAQALFGTGEARVFCSGAPGDLWVTEWTIEDDQPDFHAQWQCMVDFVLQNADAPPIYWAWSDRRHGKPIGAPVEVDLSFDLTWIRPGTREPLPRQPLPNNHVSTLLLFLRRDTSAIFSFVTPFAKVDAEFAAWERELWASLGIAPLSSRWSLTWLTEDFSHGSWKSEQGRYRREDWLPGRSPSEVQSGPWDPLLEGLLALGVRQVQVDKLTDQLLAQPMRETALALIDKIRPLKGAPVERAAHLVRQWAERVDQREALEPAIAALLADPPQAKTIRQLAYALAPASGDDWLVHLLLPHFEAKKVPTPVLDLVEEMYVYQDEALAPLQRARVLVTALRRLRKDGAWSKRATLRNCLGRADDGSAWVTWVLEAATPGKGYDNLVEPWTESVLERWQSRDRVQDPAAQAWLARVPVIEPRQTFEVVLEPLEFMLDATQRAALEEAELRWLDGR